MRIHLQRNALGKAIHFFKAVVTVCSSNCKGTKQDLPQFFICRKPVCNNSATCGKQKKKKKMRLRHGSTDANANIVAMQAVHAGSAARCKGVAFVAVKQSCTLHPEPNTRGAGSESELLFCFHLRVCSRLPCLVQTKPKEVHGSDLLRCY